MSGKRFRQSQEKVKSDVRYGAKEAIALAVETGTANFDESVDVAINLGIDPKQSDQQVRGAIALPHGLGKTVRVLVFAKGDKENEAKAAGADFIGADDLVTKIQGGWLDFDKAIATPDMMVTVSKVAKILGPRGLMPNPKIGTVTFDIGKAVTAEKKGKLDFRVDKAGIIHAVVGRKSLGAEKITENFMTLMTAVMKAKPATSKGIYLRGLTVSTTMGPGVAIDVNKVSSAATAEK
ncbi:MAG: 50S ribosomal protein L1 [Bdellovibrionales bacterium]